MDVHLVQKDAAIPFLIPLRKSILNEAVACSVEAGAEENITIDQPPNFLLRGCCVLLYAYIKTEAPDLLSAYTDVMLHVLGDIEGVYEAMAAAMYLGNTTAVPWRELLLARLPIRLCRFRLHSHGNDDDEPQEFELELSVPSQWALPTTIGNHVVYTITVTVGPLTEKPFPPNDEEYHVRVRQQARNLIKEALVEGFKRFVSEVYGHAHGRPCLPDGVGIVMTVARSCYKLLGGWDAIKEFVCPPDLSAFAPEQLKAFFEVALQPCGDTRCTNHMYVPQKSSAAPYTDVELEPMASWSLAEKIVVCKGPPFDPRLLMFVINNGVL